MSYSTESSVLDTSNCSRLEWMNSMGTRLGSLGVLALAAAGCGGSSGPAVLLGSLAFPVVIVYGSPSPVVGEGAPDGGWPGIDLELMSLCYISDSGFAWPMTVYLTFWNPDGGQVITGTWPFIDPSADPSTGSASVSYRGDSFGVGVGGSVTLTEAGPAYVGSFVTTVNGQSLSGSFSTAAQNQCGCTQLADGGMSCPWN
jgi:hypothetical protein